MQWGGTTYPWHAPRIVGLIGGFICLTVLFVLRQIRLGERATLPPRFFSQRTIAASLFFMTFFAAGFFMLSFFLPLYFQSINGVSATKSGVEILPFLLATVLSTVVSGGIITCVGYYTPFLTAGASLFCIGSGLLSTCGVHTPFAKLLGYQILMGIGVGIAIQVPIIAVQTVLPLADVAIGTACVMFFQTLGGALFVSVGQTIFLNGVTRGIRKFAPSVNPEVLLKAGATEIRNVLASLGLEDQLPGALEAYMVGLRDCFKVMIACSAIAAVAGCFVEWRTVKGKEANRQEIYVDSDDICESCRDLEVKT